MSEPGIGRVLVASLHQSIAELLPTRLEFYENWLNPHGLRHGTIGLAPLIAVLSFLRREGEAYPRVVERAGEYAAEWTLYELSPSRRLLIRTLPDFLRRRAALRLLRLLVRESYGGSRASVRLRRGTGEVEIRGSIFCGVRERSEVPLCGFYAAASARLLALLELPASASVTRCRGTGERGCLVTVTGGESMPAPASEVGA